MEADQQQKMQQYFEVVNRESFFKKQIFKNLFLMEPSYRDEFSMMTISKLKLKDFLWVKKKQANHPRFKLHSKH